MNPAASTALADLAIRHLLLCLRPLNRALAAAVDRQARLAQRLARPDLVPLCITDDQVAALLADIDAQAAGQPVSEGAPEPTDTEWAEEATLRKAADALNASLPVEALVHGLTLQPFETEAILLCAAPELERSYERIYAYILDDLNRRSPCVELLAGLTAPTFAERAARVRALGPQGRLRRLGLIHPVGDAPTALRQNLRLAPLALDFLLGVGGTPAELFRDPDEVAHLHPLDPAPPALLKLGRVLGGGGIDLVGLWGSPIEEALASLAQAAQRPIRRLPLKQLKGTPPEIEKEISTRLATASALGALLWIDLDGLDDPSFDPQREALQTALIHGDAATVLTGRHPWRPTALLAARSYAEHTVAPAGFTERRALWSEALPGLPHDQATALATRLRLQPAEVRAVARVALTRTLLGEGPITEHLDAACRAVTRKRSDHFATAIEPRRGPKDLILPASLHTRVMEIAHFFRAWPQVGEAWGFAQRMTGGSGIKALFTGDPGTGKTLAAEVIARELGLQLLRVDLARITSKWVGETEKNLDSAFREARESHAVLFFDEAEALFGKRADVRHGTDRYANLEVSYLLQQLDEHDGLVILATNLKEQIDKAFFRRFQVVAHFPRPGRDERLRLWQLAFPSGAPCAELDFEALLDLDMTGASITSAARTAAFLAAGEGAPAICMRHLVVAISRRYHHEARVLRPRELGKYAEMLEACAP